MSDIDPNVIVDNERVHKSDLREQFTIAKNEITELQQRNSPARIMAYSDDPFGENDVANAAMRAANLSDLQDLVTALVNLENASTVEMTAGAAIAMTASQKMLIVNKTVGSATAVTLPVGARLGTRVSVVDGKGDAETNNITITGDAINNDTTLTISFNQGWAHFVRATSKWIIVG